MFKKHPFELIKSKCEQVFKGRYQIYDDDIIYDSMLSICLQYNKSKDRIENFNAWLNGAIHHHFCSYITKKEKEKLDLIDTSETELISEPEDEFTKLKQQEIFHEITKLSSPVKEILEMKIYQNKSYSEISGSLEIKEATIRKHVSRGIQTISKKLTFLVTISISLTLYILERSV